MSQMPKVFIDSDDEATPSRPNIKVSPHKDSYGIEKMTINAGTSSTQISDNDVRADLQGYAPADTPPQIAQMDFHMIIRKLDALARSITGLSNRQQVTHNLLVDMKRELDILRASSSRFVSSTNTAGMKVIKKPKYLP